MQRVIVAAWLPRLALRCCEMDRGGGHLEQHLENLVVVIDDEKPGWTLRGVSRIVDATPDLRELGVVPPMRILDAQRVAPALDAVSLRQSRLQEEMQAQAELCLNLSPLVEPVGDILFLDLTGIPRPVAAQLLELEVMLEEAGHESAIAASPGKGLSAALARAAWLYRRGERAPRIFAPAERVAEVLDRLPLEVLALSPELQQALSELGLVTARDLGRLRSLPGLSVRLAHEAQTVLDLIAHHDRAPVQGIEPPDQIVEVLDLDWSLAAIEPLLFVLRPRAERLLSRLRARGERLLALSIEMSVLPLSGSGAADEELSGPAERTLALVFPEPIGDDKALLNAISARLERVGLPGEVHKVRLIVDRATLATARQPRLDLMGAEGAEAGDVAPQALSGLLAELVAELGPEAVGCLEPRAAVLPERMTHLRWPGQDTRSGLARRGRGAHGTLPEEAGEAGLFLNLWPWPVRLLRRPIAARSEEIETRTRFCRLEGEDERDQPYLRDYWILTLKDGRRALGLIDPEDEELCIQGWFD